VPYHPQTPLTRWLHEHILAALREHGELNTTELGEALGWRALPLTMANCWCVRCGCGHRPTHPDPAKRDPHDGVRFLRMNSAVMQPTMTAMEKAGELVRRRFATNDIWRWSLGPDAPATIDVDDLEALLAHEAG
jgi:hypothetical protein